VATAANGQRTLLVGHSLDQVAASTAALATLLALGLPALLVLVGGIIWRVIGRALAPVDAIRSEVDAISTSQLHRRVPQPTNEDEIGRLAQTMNRMLDRLETANSRQRRFVADASHELRTPVAAIRQHAEVAIAHPEAAPALGLARIVRVESLRMQALIDDLLMLTQADEQVLLVRRQPIDADDLVLAEARRLRELGTVSVDARGVTAVRVEGDPAALRRVLHNLGGNAARHARRTVRFELSGREGWAQLHVDDDGPGVAEEDRTRAFDRFVRLDDSRARLAGGSGLGLAIVAEIVDAHGGSVVIEDSPLGGARLTVRLRSRPMTFSLASAPTGHPPN
jgi:signal transduction histidine kinase